MECKLKKCPICKKEFDIGYFVDYIYKRTVGGKVVMYCGYNCYRTAEKESNRQKGIKKNVNK